MARKPKVSHKAPSPKGPFRLNLGCGNDLRKDFINIDIMEDAPEGVLKFDLNNCKEKRLPYPDGSVELIHASHVLEHIPNLSDLMNECHRVLKVGGVFTIQVPIYPAKQAFSDPTHCNYFTDETFRYWTRGDFYWETCGKNYGFLPYSTRRQQIANGWEMGVTLIK